MAAPRPSVHALRRSVVVAAESRRRIHGARMQIPVQGTEFTRVLAVVVESEVHSIMTAHTLVVREFLAGEWPVYRELRLRALQESPDAYGSIYAAESGQTDEEWAERLARGVTSEGELPLIAEFDGEPSGLSWVRIEESMPEAAHLYQMWVAPECRRHGVGRALVDAAAAWARAMGARQFELDVTCDNEAAIRLYEGAGFVVHGESRPLRPGSVLRAQGMGRGL
jgi:ribosomal protein S18 acetylase RimI-like enzyme